MAQASIPVDLFNPGQVFACLGFVEAADQLLGQARGGFGWSDDNTVFHLSADAESSPIASVLDFLDSASVRSLVPEDAELSTEKWSVPNLAVATDRPYPIRTPDSPATLPAHLDGELDGQSRTLVLDHWGDATRRDNVKFWAGAGGYPGAGLLRDALDLVRGEMADAHVDPFNLARPQSSSFRFDWRRDYIPLDAGFSPNLHGSVVMVGYPIVEILAAIGLTHARPRRAERTKLEYRYGVLGSDSNTELYDPIFLRAALGGAEMDFPCRNFLMQLGWPGKEGQARCITNVLEETR